ncbi:MAG: DoxX family protein, partial [Bacteroidetes bacterium]
GLVALAFLFAGTMKLITPYAELTAEPGMAWAKDFSATQIQGIGALEVLGALGLILPILLKKWQFLVPLAAIGLALIMVGAAAVHLGRGEPIIPNIGLFVLAALTAWFRRDLLRRGPSAS